MHANSPCRWLASAIALAVLMLNLQVAAQGTNATCVQSSWVSRLVLISNVVVDVQLLYSPSILRSKALARSLPRCSACVVETVSQSYRVYMIETDTILAYNIAALPNNTVYLGPTIDEVNPCQCNTVVYSLMSACALCQNRNVIS